MITPVLFERKTFRVEAVHVTRENLAEVAKWCEGEVKEGNRHPDDIEKYVDVVVNRIGRIRTEHAYPGSWISRLWEGSCFKIYSNKAFTEAFARVDTHQSRYDEILQMVLDAMLKQDAATYHGDGSGMGAVAKKTTEEILRLFS